MSNAQDGFPAVSQCSLADCVDKLGEARRQAFARRQELCSRRCTQISAFICVHLRFHFFPVTMPRRGPCRLRVSHQRATSPFTCAQNADAGSNRGRNHIPGRRRRNATDRDQITPASITGLRPTWSESTAASGTPNSSVTSPPVTTRFACAAGSASYCCANVTR